MKTATSGALSPLNIPEEDLRHCHEVMGIETWQRLAGQRIFITGGTGFVGKWLLATLLDADQKLNLGCKITVLSRNPGAFLKQWPLMEGRVKWVTGDVRDFPLCEEQFDTVIHAATDVVAQATPNEVFSTCIEGTQRVLELAKRSCANRFLLVSSGAIYGPLPPGMSHVPETYLGGPDPLLAGSAYSEGKRVAEWLTSQAASDQLEVKIARVFAVVGPHLPLDRHFAIGNFIGAAIKGNEIIIHGDGTPYRSYLYAADMASWLWSVLLKGSSGEAYNVGAEESVSISQLAKRVCKVLGASSRIETRGKKQDGIEPTHYVPDCGKARYELCLPIPLTLDKAIKRTAEWHVRIRKPPMYL